MLNICRSQVHNTLLQNNREPDKCSIAGAVCDKQCSSEGCWGPGNRMCLSCRTYNVDDECVPSCDPNLGLYEAGESHCMKCHPQCERTCFGPGADNCHACRAARDGPFCVAECPNGKYLNNSTGECMECHDNCVNGCYGPDNSLGPNGCKSCDKAIINSDLEVNTTFSIFRQMASNCHQLLFVTAFSQNFTKCMIIFYR